MRNHKAIFERRLPQNQWNGEHEQWKEVCREWVGLMPLNGRELLAAQQVEAHTSHKVRVTHSPTMAAVTTDCRMKIAKAPLVDEENIEAEANYRVFQIDSMVNVREQNREFELTVQERV